MQEENIIDVFEYKGKIIYVHKDSNQEYYFEYEEMNGNKIRLSVKEMNDFITSSFSHTTINNNVVDLVEKSIKINDFLFNFKDLKDRIKKYK